MQPSILIVDDHEIVREGIRRLINRSRPVWEICGEATSGGDAIEAAVKLHPQIIVLDITMPGMSGLEAAAQISKLCPDCRILIFTMHDSERLTAEIRGVGAHGYVQKSQAARDLVVAIERLLSGETFFTHQPTN